MSSTAILHLNLLGNPELWLGQEPIKLKSKKAVALLAYLTVTKRSHTRGALVGLFWGGVAEQNARASLRVLLHELPKPLLDLLQITGDEIALNPARPLQVDVDGIADNPRCYRGDFLEGFQLNDTAEFDIWVAQQREQIRQQVLARLDQLIGQSIRESEFKEALGYAQQSLSIEPWRESSHRSLMHIWAINGDRVAALSQFKRCQQVLKAEFDVEPMPETLALYHQIVANQLPSASPPKPATRGNPAPAQPTSPEEPLLARIALG